MYVSVFFKFQKYKKRMNAFTLFSLILKFLSAEIFKYNLFYCAKDNFIIAEQEYLILI